MSERVKKGVQALCWVGAMFVLPAQSAPAVQVGFSPEGSAQGLVLHTIDSAQKEIQLMGYAFTSPEIAKALIDAYRRGVDVKVVVDRKANAGKTGKAALNLLSATGIEVRTVSRYGAMHDKVMVIDGQTTQVGSLNYSRAAARRNSENVIVLYDMPDIAKQYQTHWQSRWAQGQRWKADY